MASLTDTQLSALAAGIDEMSTRVATLATELDQDGASDVATALYEVERSLQMANRSLDRARRSLPT